MKTIRVGIILLVGLIAFGGWMFWKLTTREEPPINIPPPMEPAKIVAKRQMPAFTLLTGEDLDPRPSSPELGQAAPKVDGLTGRYLLVEVKKGGEVKDEIVAPESATKLLSDAVAVSIPTTATTFVGGQLRAGDIVDLIAVRCQGSPAGKKFESLLVLNIVQANKDTGLPNAINLAISSAQRDDFASAVAGGNVLVTRKIALPKPTLPTAKSSASH
jgi:Flp pilus assembly protein CpaB